MKSSTKYFALLPPDHPRMDDVPRKRPVLAGPPITGLSDRIKRVIKSIPRGRVASYGQVAALAGHHRAARAVAWILHSSSAKAKLPWHRVINRKGAISLKPGRGFEEQKALLQSEGIAFNGDAVSDLSRHWWSGAHATRRRSHTGRFGG